MNIVSIKVSAKHDTEVQFPELNELAKQGKVPLGMLNRVGILEGGMESGRTSVGIFIELPDGTHAMAQLSCAQFWQIASAVKGAAARFGETIL